MSISKKQFKTELFIFELLRNEHIIVRQKQKSNDYFVNKDAKLYFRKPYNRKEKRPANTANCICGSWIRQL